jgi:hypothetical protein
MDASGTFVHVEPYICERLWGQDRLVGLFPNMSPRNFRTLPVLCLLFITIGALGSPSTNHTNGVSIARFFRKGTAVRSVDGLSDAEQHATSMQGL